MLRLFSLVMLGSSSIALAQVPPAPPEQAPPVEEAAQVEEGFPEEPPMKKVCRRVEVVGSAIGRTVCTMKPVRAPKPKN